MKFSPVTLSPSGPRTYVRALSSCVVSPLPHTSKPGRPPCPPPTTPSGGPTPPFLFNLPYFLAFLHTPVDNVALLVERFCGMTVDNCVFLDARSTYAQVNCQVKCLRRCRLPPSLRSVATSTTVNAGCGGSSRLFVFVGCHGDICKE